MQSHREKLELLDKLVADTVGLGIAGCRAEDERSDGRHVRLQDRELLNFGSCSYLGLELDARLIEGATLAMRRHGIETSSSRAYLSSPLYAELEALLGQIFQAHVVVAPTTTLGHLSALPTLVDAEDAIILDHQVHSSVQMAARFVQGSGTHVEVVRHNHLERLEKRVAKLSERHPQVWYMADGVYSMFGDLAPNARLVEMLEQYPQMRYYVDDAHGMSWCGPRGAGSVLDEVSLHPRMILTTGLAKGFGTGGGVIILPDEDQRRRVQSCGPTLIFSGPLQPPILGAAIESAKIHLSDEIGVLQKELRDRIDLCHALFSDRALPIVSSPRTPVGFIGTGPTRACQILCQRLADEGLFTNPAQFPATPARRTGGRFLLTRHHRLEDIEKLVEAVDRHWEASVRDAGAKPEEVWKAFDLEPPVAPLARATSREEIGLYVEVSNSIEKLDAEEWDGMLGDRGCLGSQAMRLFERVFGPEAEPENRWAFRYYIVRDSDGMPVLATCFTAALWKADMLASAEVSRRVEARRVEDPLYLTQRVFSMGCLLSEGDHLWLRDPVEAESGRAALALLMGAVRADAEALACDVRMVRDVPDSEGALHAAFEAEGLFRMSAPESMVLEDLALDEDALIARLPRKHRYHQRNYVRPFDGEYETEVIGEGGRALSEAEAAAVQQLYANVKEHNLELNTFALPAELLPEIATSPGWELVLFRARDRADPLPVGVLASYTGQAAYVPLLMGLDYEYVSRRGLYRQALRQCVERARELGKPSVLFGFSASLEKRRFGARPVAASMFVEADDHYAFDALAQISAKTG